MGRENTIQTGIKGRRVGFVGGGGYIPNLTANPSNFLSLGLAKVTSIATGSYIISYTSLQNTYGFNKSGTAYPLNTNNSIAPVVGSSVIILTAPFNFNDPNVSPSSFEEYGSRRTYWMLVGNDNSYVGGTVSATESNIISRSTSVNKEERKANQLTVKDYLKSKGLSKEAAAGLMGNIMAECSFNPTSTYDDTNNKKSAGIIQWNAGSYDINKVLAADLKGQLDLLFGDFTPATKKFLDEATANPTGTVSTNFSDAISKGLTGASFFAYVFCYTVERACGCTSVDKYLDPNGTRCGGKGPFKPKDTRGAYALDFYQRFNNPSDPLAWGS